MFRNAKQNRKLTLKLFLSKNVLLKYYKHFLTLFSWVKFQSHVTVSHMMPNSFLTPLKKRTFEIDSAIVALYFYMWDISWRTWVGKLADTRIFQKSFMPKNIFLSEISKLLTYFFTKIFLERRSWLYRLYMVALFLKT